MANSLNKIFVNVADGNVSAFLTKVMGTKAVTAVAGSIADGVTLYTKNDENSYTKVTDATTLNKTTTYYTNTDDTLAVAGTDYVVPVAAVDAVAADTSYDSKICFLGSTGQIFTQGNLYGVDATAYDALKALVDTLVGSDTNKSARTIAAEEVAKIVDSAPEAFDTLKEIADWLSNDDNKDAADIVTAIGHEAKAEVSHSATAEEAAADTTGTLKEGDKVVDTAAVEATGLYKLIADNATLIDTKIAALDATDNVSDAAMGIKVQVDEVNGVVSKPVVTVTAVKLGDAVGMTQVTASDLTTITTGEGESAVSKTYLTSTLSGEGTTESPYTAGENAVEAKVGDYIAADGSITSDGVASASDVAAEIVADEKVIASALNDHETRIAAVESATGSEKAKVTFTAATAGSGTEGETGYVAPAAATIVSDSDTKILDGSAIAEIKKYVDAQDHDHSVTTVATSSTDGEKSAYVTISDGATSGSNDHAYTVKIVEAVYSASDDKFSTDGLVSSTTLNSVIGDLWETYSAS